VFTDKALEMAEASLRPWSRVGDGRQVPSGSGMRLDAESPAAQGTPQPSSAGPTAAEPTGPPEPRGAEQ
jgi:arginine decarboxylase